MYLRFFFQEIQGSNINIPRSVCHHRTLIVENRTIYNMIRWFASLLGQMTLRLCLYRIGEQTYCARLIAKSQSVCLYASQCPVECRIFVKSLNLRGYFQLDLILKCAKLVCIELESRLTVHD